MTKNILKRLTTPAIATAILSTASVSAPSSAQASEYWLGQVITFAGSFCPRTTLPADGRLLPIPQYTALFSLLGSIYGGDARTTFALPDLRDRSPVHTSNDFSGMGDVRNFGDDSTTPKSGGSLAMSMCIVTEGLYPSRS